MGGLDAANARVAGASRSLSESVARLRAITGKDFTAEIAEGFDAAQVLVDRSARQDIAVVVMATRAPGTLGLFIRGSVADRVTRERAPGSARAARRRRGK
jgi:nucleotide-binding universal stress UspA family protein